MKFTPARYLFGLAILASGICAVVYRHLDQLNGLPQTALTPLAGVLEILAGAAMLWPRLHRQGAIAIASVYLVFAAIAFPAIVLHPLVYNGYGNFFEQLSIVAGALMIFARSPSSPPARIGFDVFAVCLLSFALEQYFYLAATASLVPAWMPAGQRFWAIATTVFFALAGLALLTGLKARLAARLTAAMLVGFALLTWLPVVLHNPHGFFSWAETFETLAIAATAWLAADHLTERPA